MKLRKFVVSLIALLLLGEGAAVSAANLQNGRELYDRHCAQCHGQDGRGVHPLAPNFRQFEGLMVSDRKVKEHIRMGKAGCPSFAGIIKDAHLLDVVTYLRVFR